MSCSHAWASGSTAGNTGESAAKTQLPNFRFFSTAGIYTLPAHPCIFNRVLAPYAERIFVFVCLSVCHEEAVGEEVIFVFSWLWSCFHGQCLPEPAWAEGCGCTAERCSRSAQSRAYPDTKKASESLCGTTSTHNEAGTQIQKAHLPVTNFWKWAARINVALRCVSDAHSMHPGAGLKGSRRSCQCVLRCPDKLLKVLLQKLNPCDLSSHKS